MISAFVPLLVWAFVGYQLWRVRWGHWLSLIAQYVFIRPYLSSSTNNFLNMLGACVVVYAWNKSIYNKYMHPLSNYPGSLFAGISRIPWTFHRLLGDYPQWIRRLHRKYGPVVRIAPDELSYISSEAPQHIYCERGSKPPFARDATLNEKCPNNVYALPDIASEKDHAHVRSVLMHGLSEKAVIEQEPVIRKHVDVFLRCVEKEPGRFDIGTLFTYAIFDVISDLALGASFNTLTDAKPRHWVMDLQSLAVFKDQAAAIAGLGLVARPFAPMMVSPASRFQVKEHLEQCVKMIHSNKDHERSSSDIVSSVTAANAKTDTGEKQMTPHEIEANMWILFPAGIQNTANALTAAMSFLLQKPTKLQKLVYQLRQNFTTPSDISLKRLVKQPYLNAVLNETLRLAPPVVQTSLRIVDADNISVCGRALPKDTKLSFAQYAAYRSPQNFRYAATFIPERWLVGDAQPSSNATSSNGISPGTDDPFFTSDTFVDDKLNLVRPFSVGNKNCAGEALAWAQMRLFLALLVYKFDMLGPAVLKEWEKQKYWNSWARSPLLVSVKKDKEEKEQKGKALS